MKRLYALWAILIVGSLLTASCDNPISLGSRLSMDGPLVSIAEPTPNRALFETDPTVVTLFGLTGTVRDEVKVTLMTVTLDYWNAEAQTLVRMGREFKWEGQWFTRESDDNAWRPYTPMDYDPADADPDNPVEPPSWRLNKNNVTWNLPVFMNRMEKGDYFITVSAWNTAGRHDSGSTAKLKIKYNNKAPSVKITNPILLDGGGSLAAPRPPSWDEYIFDPLNKPEETSLNLRYFTNSFRDLRYLIEYTLSVPTEFSFEITNEHNLDDFGDEKTVYYNWQWDGEEFPPLRGIFTDRGGAVGTQIDTYTKAGDLIELSETIQNSIAPDAVTPMQMVTRVKDTTGFEESKSKGWFLYLPDSDKPYPDINFVYKVHKDAQPPQDAPELALMARGSSNYNNIAYDDDGVKELRWTLYKLNDTSLEVEKIAGSDVITFDGNRKEPWSFRADRDYGTGRFKIIVQVQDIFDTWGDEYHGYFTITSNSIPSVIVPLASPDSLTTTFWGDSYGNITIAGRAQIEDFDECDGVNHGVSITEVAIAWIRSDRGIENNFRYTDPNDPGWNAANGFVDTYGNRIWKIEPAFVPATAGNNNENLQEEWTFSKTLNYFNDLRIGMGANRVPFTDQQFRIRVTGGDIGSPPRSGVYSFTTRGDMAAPAVEITEIIIEHDSRAVSYAFVSYGVLPSIAKDDRIMLKGTFSDDSIGQWSSLGDERHRTLLTVPEVTWESETRQFKFEVTSFTMDAPDGGRWETEWYTFGEHNSDPIVQLTTSVTDIGGRLGTGSAFMAVETADPVLIRISSDNDDGYYGNNKQTAEDPAARYIDIFFEFNKPVTFLPSGAGQTLTYSNAPRLELNNGGEAFYHSGSGTYRIIFRYFVDGVVNPPLNTAVDGKGGGSSPAAAGNPEGRLNVANVNFNGFEESLWKSLTDIPVIFKKTDNRLNLCEPSDIFSLAGQKRIIIDKMRPVITGVTSPASTERHHGAGSQIYIEVTFNKDVQVTGATSANTYVTLVGGNLDDFSARAVYDHVKDARTVSFVYTVGNGHDTSASVYSQKFMGVSQAIIGAAVTDFAGNILAEYPAIPGSPVHLNGVVIDTVPPEPPFIAGNIGNGSYYSPTDFYIGGLEPGGGTVEYHLNYPTSGGVPETGWNAYSGIIAGGQTGPITLDLNGVYRIAARQYDTATTTPNCSQPSPVVTVRINNGAVLERMRSSLADGAYAHAVLGKDVITVDMEFRVPVTLAGGYSAGNLPPVNAANITLNTSGGSTNLARLLSAPANSARWTFEYVIPEGAGTPANTFLEVTAINLDGLVINDQYGTRVNGPNGFIKLNDLPIENKFSSQKKMTVLAGRPHVVDRRLGYGIVFTGTQLRLDFDRDIYRGLTKEKLMIRQISDGYRIPAVLTEDKWNDAFINRTDIFTEQSDITGGLNGWSSAAWRSFGAAVYERGSNGATPQGTNKLVSDTAVKRILKYEIDPDIDGSIAPYSMTAVRTLFRAAEALTFIPHDREITIEGNTLTINLNSVSPGRPLPVKGARYEWIFPNGFIQDTLGTANGTGEGGETNPTGRDANLSSGNTPDGDRVLFYSSAAEPPVIRIDKGSDIETLTNTEDRQALQPVTTTVKINSRTPNATVTYWVRQTTDSVNRLLLRGVNENLLSLYALPLHIWNPQTPADDDWNDNIVMRPQSGTAGYTAPAGVDPAKWAAYGPTWWADMSPNWGSARNYSTDFTIGSENYADGGMIINIRARTQATGVTNTANDYGYESAYRSVFVNFKQSEFTFRLPSGETGIIGGESGFIWLHIVQRAGMENRFFSGLDRVWIRGSDSMTGDSTIPDFPLSRDLTKSRKARLLTPIDYSARDVVTHDTVFTADDIPPVMIDEPAAGGFSTFKPGSYTWFWVTWKLNVPAFIDVFHGELPEDPNDPYQTPRTTLRYIIGRTLEFKEYYPVFPGRTTVVHYRRAADNAMGPEFNAPPRSD